MILICALAAPVGACRASDKCQKEKRKTINGDDLLWAMATLGFEEYVEPLKMYLHKYREVSDGSCSLLCRCGSSSMSFLFFLMFLCICLMTLLCPPCIFSLGTG